MITALVYIALTIYFLGAMGHSMTLTAILCKTEWSKNAGLLIISSLTLSDLIYCCFNFFGVLQSVVVYSLGHHVEYFVHPMINRILGVYNTASYASFTCHMLVMASNRFCAVILPTYFTTAFTPWKTKVMLLICWLAGSAWALLHSVFCCSLVYNIDETATLPLIPANATYELTVPDLLTSLIGTCIPLVLYLCVAMKFVQLKHFAINTGTVSHPDLTLCLQFVVILLLFVAMCISFNLSPTFPFLEKISGLLSAMNFSVNPIVYWTFNRTIRKAIRELFSCKTNTMLFQQVTNKQKGTE
jgi:hypothetical protein